MSGQLMPLQPSPSFFAATAATTFLIATSTLASLGSLLRQSKPNNSLYQDENGTATIESQERAQEAGKSACTRALAVGSLGLAVAATDVMREAGGPFEVQLSVGAINFIFWVLLCGQAACAVAAPTCAQRYKASRSAVWSSVIATVHLVFTNTGRETLDRDLSNFCLLLAFGATLACVPRLPVVYLGNREVLPRQGSSLLSWITFSYDFLHRNSSEGLSKRLALHHVPRVDFGLRTRTLRDQLGSVGTGAKLWLQLIRYCHGPLILQWSLVLLKALAEFGSQYALFNFLRSMEDGIAPASRPWTWTGMLSLGLLLGTVADAWLLWTTDSVLYTRMTSVLETLVLEKYMRKEIRNGDSPEADSNRGRIFKDTHSIVKAFLDNYHFPMAVCKIFLDVFYLGRLLGAKSLIAGAVFPVVAALFSGSLARQHQALQRLQTTSQQKTTASLTEMLQNLHDIRLSSLEQLWSRRLRGCIADEQRCSWATSIGLEKLNLLSSIGPILLASVAISLHALEAGSLSPAVAFTALSFFSSLQAVFAQLPAKAAILHKSWISVQQLQDYLQQPDQKKCAEVTEQLLLEGASLSWPGKADKSEKATAFALTGVTLCFPRNGLSIITGKVGSGKSLLLAALLDEASVTSGRLGRPSLGARRADGIVPGSTAYVSQPPWIDKCSIRDNVVFGYPFDATRYETVLKACALDQDLAALGDGDGTMAGAGGSALSGGQKWRVALARALYSPAEIIMLEDVLGAVDTPIASWICKHALTGEVAAGRTVLLATHRPEFCVAAASYVVIVENGTAFGNAQQPIMPRQTGSDTPPPKLPVDMAEEKKATSPSPSKQPTHSPSTPYTQRSALQIVMFYLRSAGLRMYLFGVFVTVCHQALNAAHTWWLSRWTVSVDGGPSQQAATIWNIALYIVLSVAGVLALAAQSLVFATVGLAASKSLYQHIVQRVLGATLLWMDSTPYGELFDIIDTDMHIIDRLIAPALNGVFGTILQLGVIVIVSLYSNIYTAFSSIIILALYAYIGPSMVEPQRRLRGLLGPAAYPISDHTNAMVLGLPTIRAFGRTQLFMDRFCELVDESSTVGVHIILGNCRATIRSGLLGCAFVTATAAAMVHNNIDAATTGFTITLALQTRLTLRKLLGQFSTIRMGLSAADRVMALTKVPTEVNGGRDVPDWPSQGSLEVDAISMKYGPDLPPVLKNVSFSARSHERIGIVGRTGAGKSSLTNALLRFVELADGDIRIDGVRIADVALRQLRSAVRIIPQDPLLFSGTLRTNLDPGGEKSDDDLVAVLRRVRLVGVGGAALPGADAFSLDMQIEARGANLSHGQRQLVCLARAILAECRILVLDEATSGMDGATDEIVQKFIQDECADTMVMVVAHKLLTVAGFDKILVMSQGEVCEAGAPAELYGEKGVFYDMVNRSGIKGKIQAAMRRR